MVGRKGQDQIAKNSKGCRLPLEKTHAVVRHFVGPWGLSANVVANLPESLQKDSCPVVEGYFCACAKTGIAGADYCPWKEGNDHLPGDGQEVANRQGPCACGCPHVSAATSPDFSEKDLQGTAQQRSDLQPETERTTAAEVATAVLYAQHRLPMLAAGPRAPAGQVEVMWL